MRTSDDTGLLQAYAGEGSEEAFAEIVRRHVNLVYSTALRKTGGDAHLSQDVTQTVFTDLAAKARSLPANVVLGGWLHHHTCFRAADAVRRERRRQAREQKAANMQNPDQHSDESWNQLAPILDDALERLSARDRDAIVLRFFEGRNLREVGQALAVTEDAAQKRVSRALEKLRRHFARRGVTASVTLIATALATHSVQAAPADFAGGLAGASLAGASGAATGGLTTILETLLMTKTKIAVVTAVVLATVVTPVVWYQWGPNAPTRPLQATYELREGETLKHVAGPFIPERTAYYHREINPRARGIMANPPTLMVFRQNPLGGLEWQLWLQLGDRKPDLRGTLRNVAQLKRYEVDGPEELLALPVSGDWTVRDGASRESLMAALEPVLGKITQRNLRLEKRTVERDAIVVRGGLETGFTKTIEIYAANANSPRSGRGREGTLQYFLEHVRDLLEMPLVSEAQPAEGGPRFPWYQHNDARLAQIQRPEVIEQVLKNLTVQTGLSFKRELRPVEVWFVTEQP